MTAIQDCVAGPYASTTVGFADAPCWLLYHDPIVAINSFHARRFDRPGESSEAMDGKKEKAAFCGFGVVLYQFACVFQRVRLWTFHAWNAEVESFLPCGFPKNMWITFALRKQSSWFCCLYTACNGTAMSVGWQPPEHDLPCSTQFHCCSYIVWGFLVQERFGARALSLP